jgi:hypothetical protein
VVVTLEAIFLSTFVLISQNRLSAETEHRADLDLHIGLPNEHELTRVLQMLDAIQAKLGIENHENSELADIEMETKPEDVLAQSRVFNSVRAAEKSPRYEPQHGGRGDRNRTAGALEANLPHPFVVVLQAERDLITAPGVEPSTPPVARSHARGSVRGPDCVSMGRSGDEMLLY